MVRWLKPMTVHSRLLHRGKMDTNEERTLPVTGSWSQFFRCFVNRGTSGKFWRGKCPRLDAKQTVAALSFLKRMRSAETHPGLRVAGSLVDGRGGLWLWK